MPHKAKFPTARESEAEFLSLVVVIFNSGSTSNLSWRWFRAATGS